MSAVSTGTSRGACSTRMRSAPGVAWFILSVMPALVFSKAAAGLDGPESAGGPVLEAAEEFTWRPDVRIGTRIDMSDIEFDYDRQTGNLFLVTGYPGSSGDNRWAVWVSTDGGYSWEKSYDWVNPDLYICEVTHVAASVCGDYLYVAYIHRYRGSGSKPWLYDLLIRRFFVANGSPDWSYYSSACADCRDIVGVHCLPGGSFGESPVPRSIAMTSNADGADNSMFLFAVLDDYRMLFWRGDAASGAWGQFPCPIINAAYGLDAAYCYLGTYMLYLSYVGYNIGLSGSATTAALNPLCVARYDGYNWNVTEVEPNPRLGAATRVSAYREWVMTVYEYDLFTYGVGVRYRVSYDGGDSWKVGTVAAPTSDRQYQRPDVTARRNCGFAVSYLERNPMIDQCYFRWRDYGDGTPGSAPWSSPSPVSTKYAVFGQSTRVEFVPPPSNCDNAFGVVFVANVPNGQGMYFNRTAFPCVFAPGDFDHDGDVDLNDFGHFQTCFNGPNRLPATGCADADLDRDQDVDLADFQILQGCFNGPNRPPACL